MQRLNRITPVGRPGAYQTYSISRRPDTTVRAACEQVGCQNYLYGWETHLDESLPKHATGAHWIRTKSGRTFSERRDGAITVFRFEPHQRCFENHQTIAESFTVMNGDWREYRGVMRRHANGRDWAEDFGEHQQGLAEQIEKERG